MSNFKYKCTVLKNGSKRYYKNTGGKWKRISNVVGKNVEKNKRKYMMKKIKKSTKIQNKKPVRGISKKKKKLREIFDFKSEKYYKSKDFKQKCNKIGFNKNNFEKAYLSNKNNVFILAYMKNGPITGWEDGNYKPVEILKKMMENDKLTTNIEKKIMKLVESTNMEIKRSYINFVNMNNFFSDAIAKAQEILNICRGNYKNIDKTIDKYRLLNNESIKKNVQNSDIVIRIKNNVKEILKLLKACNFIKIKKYYVDHIRQIRDDNKILPTLKN